MVIFGGGIGDECGGGRRRSGIGGSKGNSGGGGYGGGVGNEGGGDYHRT